MEKAIKKAKEGGYVTGFRYDKLAEMDGITRAGEILLLDPLFWHSLFGKEYAKIKALEFMTHIFDGGTPDTFFEQIPDLGTKQST